MRNSVYLLITTFLLLPSFVFASQFEQRNLRDSMRKSAKRSARLTNIQFCSNLENYFEAMDEAERIFLGDGKESEKVPSCADDLKEAVEMGITAPEIFEAIARKYWRPRWARTFRLRLEKGETDRVPELWVEMWDILHEFEDRFGANPSSS